MDKHNWSPSYIAKMGSSEYEEYIEGIDMDILRENLRIANEMERNKKIRRNKKNKWIWFTLVLAMVFLYLSLLILHELHGGK